MHVYIHGTVLFTVYTDRREGAKKKVSEDVRTRAICATGANLKMSWNVESRVCRSLTKRLVFCDPDEFSATLRSDNRFILVLRCSNMCLNIDYNCCCVCKLLIYRVIDKHSAPKVEQKLKAIIEGQLAIRSDWSDLKTSPKSTGRLITSFNTRLNKIEDKVKDTEEKVRGSEGENLRGS